MSRPLITILDDEPEIRQILTEDSTLKEFIPMTTNLTEEHDVAAAMALAEGLTREALVAMSVWEVR